jgi:hypothetical protein
MSDMEADPFLWPLRSGKGTMLCAFRSWSTIEAQLVRDINRKRVCDARDIFAQIILRRDAPLNFCQNPSLALWILAINQSLGCE